MRLSFKSLISLIAVSLIFVFGYQVYWLGNFYRQQYDKMEVDIIEAMRNADYREIYIRIEQIREDSTITGIDEIEIGVPERDALYKTPPVDTHISDSLGTTQLKSNAEFPVEIWDDVDAMLKYFQKGLHQGVGHFMPVNFPVYYELLQEELNRRNLHFDYYVVHLDLENLLSLNFLPEDISGIQGHAGKTYLFPYDLELKQAYELHVKEPWFYLLKQMSGILVASLSLIVLLILSFLYLYHIIRKQKTIDEIKSDFVNNMTHELKTPISVVHAVTDALQHYGMIDDRVKREEYLNAAREQLTHLNGLVEQILTMSVEERKSLKLSKETILLLDLFEYLKAQYLLNAAKEIEIELAVEPDNLTIQADKVHFQNVISNLIENSIKYSGERVLIRLSAGKRGDRVIISVQDDGIGIPASSIPRLFDRFYRVSTGNIHNVKGYGLGLYYVKTIVEKHGGSIEVESREGEGTVFRLTME